MTHKTFYFFRSLKISIGLIRVSQLVSLGLLTKSIENLYHSHTTKLRQLREADASDEELKNVRRSFNNEIKEYKVNAINQLLDLHPDFFDPIVDFDDWTSGMKYLEDNKNFMVNFFNLGKLPPSDYFAPTKAAAKNSPLFKLYFTRHII